MAEKETRKSSFFTPLLLAFALLTRLPLHREVENEKQLSWSAAYFPLCGYFLGIIALMPYCLMANYFGTVRNFFALSLLGAFAYVLLLAWLTRMFHLDGFADACDAFAAMRSSPEERLKVMKDPHCGAAGVTGLILLLIGKLVIVFLIMNYTRPQAEVLASLWMMPVLARFAILSLGCCSRYPRESGTGAAFIGKIPQLAWWVGLLLIMPVWLMLPWRNVVIALFFIAMTTIYWRMTANRALGGVTGDILGACCESTEIAAGLGLLLPEIINI